MSKELNVSLVVGARPNFIKVAPLVRQLENSDFKVKLIHTGQHWDEELSNEIFQDLKLYSKIWNTYIKTFILTVI